MLERQICVGERPGRSGRVVSTLVCSARGPRIELRCGQVSVFLTKITAIRSFWHGLHTYCNAQVDSAFLPPRDDK